MYEIPKLSDYSPEDSIIEIIEDGKVIARGKSEITKGDDGIAWFSLPKEFDDPAIREKVAKMFPAGRRGTTTLTKFPDGRVGFVFPAKPRGKTARKR